MSRRDSGSKTDRTPNQRSMSKLTSSGGEAEQASEATPAEEHTRDALYQRAAALGINGRSRMDKAALARAVAEHERDAHG